MKFSLKTQMLSIIKQGSSLRKQTLLFIKQEFPELSSRRNRALSFLNSIRGGVFVLIAVIVSFIPGQICNPKLLQWFPITNEVAGAILEQRISNLAAVFSITLVLIGWLITNISSKESISYQLLFKRIYLYPIFFFITGLLISLIMFSSIKYFEHLYIGNAIILGSIYVIIALAAIIFLFVQLLRVVDVSFFYTELRKDIMDEVYKEANSNLLILVSERFYKECCQRLKLSAYVQFGTHLNGQLAISIVPEGEVEKDEEADMIDSILFADNTHIIHDIDIARLEKSIGHPVQGDNYYVPLYLGMKTNIQQPHFYLLNVTENENQIKSAILKAFKLTELSNGKEIMKKGSQLAHLKERLLKDTKEGKIQLMEKSLQIYREIAQLQDKINAKCQTTTGI